MTQIRIDAALCAIGVNRDGAVFDYDDYDYVLAIYLTNNDCLLLSV